MSDQDNQFAFVCCTDELENDDARGVIVPYSWLLCGTQGAAVNPDPAARIEAGARPSERQLPARRPETRRRGHRRVSRAVFPRRPRPFLALAYCARASAPYPPPPPSNGRRELGAQLPPHAVGVAGPARGVARGRAREPPRGASSAANAADGAHARAASSPRATLGKSSRVGRRRVGHARARGVGGDPTRRPTRSPGTSGRARRAVGVGGLGEQHDARRAVAPEHERSTPVMTRARPPPRAPRARPPQNDSPASTRPAGSQ